MLRVQNVCRYLLLFALVVAVIFLGWSLNLKSMTAKIDDSAISASGNRFGVMGKVTRVQEHPGGIIAAVRLDPGLSNYKVKAGQQGVVTHEDQVIAKVVCVNQISDYIAVKLVQRLDSNFLIRIGSEVRFIDWIEIR